MKNKRFIFVFLLMFMIFALGLTFNGVMKAETGNLLINPDGETGNTNGWTDVDKEWIVSAEVTPHGGAYFIWPNGNHLANTTLYQDVNVTAYASAIDGGSQYFHLSGWLCNYDQYPHDRATLSIEARAANGTVLAYYQREQRSPIWTKYSINELIPAGTRSLRVNLIATRFVGTDNDAYFDDLSLMIDAAKGASISVTSATGSYNVVKGSTLQLTAKNIAGTAETFEWTSSFNAIATVDAKGLVTAVQPGRATIQARGVASGAIGNVDIIVTDVNGLVFVAPAAGTLLKSGTSTSITWSMVGKVTAATLSLSKDGGINFTEIGKIADASVKAYTWTIPTVTTQSNNWVLKLAWTGGEATSGLFSVGDSSTAVITTTTTTTTTSSKKGLIDWPDATNVTGLLGYNLYRGTVSGGQSSTPITDFPIEISEYTDQNVSSDTTYYYTVYAVYSDGTMVQIGSEIIMKPSNNQIILYIGNPNMFVNNVSKEIDPGKGTKPILLNGRTILPIRALVEELGGTINWDGATRKVTLTLGAKTIVLTIDSKTTLVNNIQATTDVAPQIINGRTMVPLRYIIDNFGYEVLWNATNKSVTISY